MIAKFAALICLFGVARAGNLYGGAYGGYGGGYGGYGGYSSGYAIAPSYAYSTPIVKSIAPVITKTIAPVAYTAPIYSAPAVSSVSQYNVHSAPIVKSIAPVSYAYSTPLIGHSYVPSLSYGYGNVGYGGYGKHAW